MIHALDRKLLRDLVRLWPQGLAIALVMAAGVTTMVATLGAYRSLSETRAAYYERNLFGHVFAEVTRAPDALVPEIRAIDGVAGVETRVSKIALLDLPGLDAPASGLLVSLPDRELAVNRVIVRRGRLPDPSEPDEVAVSEPFAEARGFRPGDTFGAIVNGRKRTLAIVGTVLSPEFVYAIGPGQIMPDPSRYGIVFMAEEPLEAAFDLEGAFSAVAVRLRRDASEEDVIDRLDALLAPYGGRGAYGRDDHPSNAFLDAELEQIAALARFMPPVFLLVAAFLVNMTMSRLVALEREQIGLLKALGYGTWQVAAHYLKFVAAIALVGVAIGAAGGTWLGSGLTRLYASFFDFPFLVFHRATDVYGIAAIVTVASAVGGALAAVLRVARLAPAVAMSPPAPTRYRAGPLARAIRWARPPQMIVMVTRHLARFPFRTATSVLGVALAVGVLLGSMWSFGAIAHMIDVTFFQSERQDATISFAGEEPYAAVFEAARLPGVMRAEPFRAVNARVRKGPVERRVSILARPPEATLSRVLDEDLEPVAMPRQGIALSSALAEILGARVGDTVDVELIDRGGRRETLVVAEIITGYLGLGAYIDLSAANRLMREGPAVSGVTLAIDEAEENALFAELKETPVASAVVLRSTTLAKFEETVAQNITMMVTVYVTLAVIIAFGVVYNFARISLSERGRELASLRVLGFSRAEVSLILMTEIAIVVLLAQPVGWVLGYGLAWITVEGFSSELYRMPLVMKPSVFAVSSLVIVGAAAVAALLVRRRVDRLDMVAVLKTRE